MTPTDQTAYRLGLVLGGLYAAVEARPVTGYRLSESDGWHRARAGNIDRTMTEHLETWIEITGATFTRAAMVLSITIHTAHRSLRDNDDASQAAMHAASLDLMEMLTRWCEPTTAARSIPLAYTAEPLNPEGDWYEIAVTATIHLPRGV